MKLINLLELVNESCHVWVWQDGERVAVYDGRDSIEKRYNNCVVLQFGTVNAVDNTIYIEIAS